MRFNSCVRSLNPSVPLSQATVALLFYGNVNLKDLKMFDVIKKVDRVVSVVYDYAHYNKAGNFSQVNRIHRGESRNV